MTKRINVIFPETTIRTIDRIAKPGERSRFINRAVEHYVATQSVEAVRKRLEITAIRDRDLDREIAHDWFGVDQETWQNPTTAKARANQLPKAWRNLSHVARCDGRA